MNRIEAQRARGSGGRKRVFERLMMEIALGVVLIAALLIVVMAVVGVQRHTDDLLQALRYDCSRSYVLYSDAWNNCVTDGLR